MPTTGHSPVADTDDIVATVYTAQAPSVLGSSWGHEKRSLQHLVLMAACATRLREARILADCSAGVGAGIPGAGFSNSAQDRPEVRVESEGGET